MGITAQASISEPSHEPGDATRNHSALEVYANFTSAVSLSLSHSLGKKRGWLQLGPNACIEVRTLGDDLFDNSELHPWLTTTTKTSFVVKWLSSGILLISFIQVRLPRLIKMSTILSRDTQSTGLPIGLPLLLSPSGVRCQYLGAETYLKSDSRRKSAVQLKASILSHLSQQGIRPMREVIWIHVQMAPDPNNPLGPPVSLWPANLCFCEDIMTPVSSDRGGPFNMPLPDGSVDPLEEAESWFLGKSARIELSRVRMLEENEKAQALKDVEDTDEEDVLSPLEVPIDQGITPQDVSGIYPTPPDGLPPPLSGSSNPNNARSGDYDYEEKEIQPSDEKRGEHDGQENDDLFGDMDIDMFASNGLTEADFSFFDEPGIVDQDLRETGQAMALDDTNETVDPPMAFDGQGILSTPNKKGDSPSDSIIEEAQGGADGMQGMHPRSSGYWGFNRSYESSRPSLPLTGSNQMSVNNDNKPPNKDNDKSLGSVVGIEDVDYGALKRLNLRHVANSQEADEGQRGSFEHVSFQESAINFDGKYSMRGRFAFDVDELPINKDGDRRSYAENQLETTRVHPEESSMEDSGNTG